MIQTAAPEPAPPITWRWSGGLLGALCSLPAALVTLHHPTEGLAMAFGALPAAAVGVQGRRRSRFVVLIVGVCIGLGLVTGAALGQSWLLAVGGIFLLCLGAAVLSAHTRVGLLLMTLPVPMAGAGLSFDGDVTAATELAALIAAGAVCGWLLCLCWPESPTTARTAGTLPGQRAMLEYGVRLGLAGAVSAGLGFALDLDHKGWATAACLLVMRPTPEMTKLRGAGRAISVSVGAFAACVLTAQAVDAAVVAAAVVVALTCLAALRTSRWYVTGGFTTFILILLLVYQSPEQAPTRFFERLVETVVGVGIALFFGVALPSMRRQRIRRRRELTVGQRSSRQRGRRPVAAGRAICGM